MHYIRDQQIVIRKKKIFNYLYVFTKMCNFAGKYGNLVADAARRKGIR